MESEDNALLQSLKKIAITEGVDLCGLSIHQGFISPDAGERKKNIDHTLHCIELAYKLGIPTMRLNTGRWNTTKDFDQLMKDRQAIEAASPFPLEWQRLDERRACRIKSVVEGGYRSPESDWPNIQVALVDRMTALEKALRPFLDKLQL